MHKGWHKLESEAVLASEDTIRDDAMMKVAEEAQELGIEITEFDFEDGRDFAKAVLETPEFRSYVMNGLRTRELPATLLIRLMDYAEGWGKPVEQVEVKDTTPQEMTPEQIKERARFYTNVINSLDEEEDDATPRGSVH